MQNLRSNYKIYERIKEINYDENLKKFSAVPSSDRLCTFFEIRYKKVNYRIKSYYLQVYITQVMC